MPRHTIHEVAVNAKLTVDKFGRAYNNISPGTVFDLAAKSSTAQIISLSNQALKDGKFDAALFFCAVLAERQHNEYCERVAHYELTQYEAQPMGHRDYKEACAKDTVNHFKIQILGERK